MCLPPVTDSFPLLQFDQPWRLLRPQLINNPQESIHYEEQLLQQVGRGEIGPCLCIKQEPQSLVVTRREARSENFLAAKNSLSATGWPVVVRCSGGSCVPQGPGVLNLSIIHPRLKSWTLEDGYLLLCELLGNLLTSYDIQAETGEVPGSFCDGRYNLQVGGKKLVGTAQRWSGGSRDQAAVLAHACLLVDLDLELATAKINQLYSLCNNPQQFEPSACTTLRKTLPPSQLSPETFVTEVEQRLAAQITEIFDISTFSCTS